MKIKEIKTYLTTSVLSADGWTDVKPFLFVKVEAGSGLTGWGEAYALAGRERAIEQTILSLADALVDHEIAGPRSFRSGAVLGFADKRTGIDFYCALSALELALWDLLGKELGAPVHQLLGGALRERIPLYVNTWSTLSPSMEQVVDRCRYLKDAGYKAVKIYPMQFPSLDQAEESVRRIREALGPETDIMIDLNALDDPHLALMAARRFEAYDPFWFEEPVTSDDIETLRRFRSKLDLRIVSGERHGGKFKFREMLGRGAADVLNPDIAGCGGILEILEIAAMAEPHSVAVSPHNYNSATVGMAAMLHVSALMPNLLTAELYPDCLAIGEAFAQVDFEITDGEATLPQSPGLGVSIDEAALARFSA